MNKQTLTKACYKGDVKAVEELLAAGVGITFDALRNAVSSHTKSEAKWKRAICERLFAAWADPKMKRPTGHASVLDVAATG